MKQWEYLCIERWREYYFEQETNFWVVGDWEGDEINLEELGLEGWELVTAVPIISMVGKSYSGVTTNVNYFFKRPI